MKQLVDWYWTHGIKRGFDPNDPDREIRKVSIGGWLDPVARIIDRNFDIQSNAGQKACLALWGPSQTGKSTMMSRYVDGEMEDGTDSALTWTPLLKTRFSPPKSGVDSIPSNTLVFNPFNHQSDASGVATRYTLKSAKDAGINTNFPVKIKFTTRAQIIQSIALGYLSECEAVDEQRIFTQEAFLDEFDSGDVINPDKEAYALLRDIANVIEFMKGHPRFSNLFKKDEWNKKIRKALVSSPRLLSSKKEAEHFLGKIFWDASPVLSKFYLEAENLLQKLQQEWSGCVILATMEVGALILDIDSYKSYVSPEGMQGQKIKEKVSALSYTRADNEIQISVKTGSGSPAISGDKFGYFQALCAELVVPLKKENLENSPKKATFLTLAEKCDFLDFPGVSNKNTGHSIGDGNAALINLSSVDASEIFTKVFKQGKTQCFVYNYVKKYGIDAFSVLVRTDRYPSQSSLLNSGICEWLTSFDSNWKPGKPTDLPVFVNMTFFASLINHVAINGIGNGLDPYVERIQGQLKFAHKRSAKFFATTYHQFPDGKIENPAKKQTTVDSILKDPVFTIRTGLTEENINAVYEVDGGLDYMFKSINEIINSNRRKDRCRAILAKDEEEILRLISNLLPSDVDCAIDARKAKLQQCKNTLEKTIDDFEQNFEPAGFQELSTQVKKLFSASSSVFDPIPLNAMSMNRKDIHSYVKAQIAKWYEDKVSSLEESDYISNEDQHTILMALRDSIDENSLFELLNGQLGQITNRIMADAARYPFSIAFGNLLQKGVSFLTSEAIVGERNPVILTDFIEAEIRKSCAKDGSPYYYTILKPLLERLETLADGIRGAQRPAQEGDSELKEIYDNIVASKQFQIM